jgi:hypothetical protein
MQDEDKTKEQLIAELAEMRQQVAAFEKLEAQRKRLEEKRAVKIGEILIEMGFLTQLQLEKSLKKQETEIFGQMLNSNRRRLGDIMVESGIISEEQLQAGLEEQQRRLHQAKQRDESRKRKPWRRRKEEKEEE